MPDSKITLTQQEQIKAIASVWGNISKLSISKTLHQQKMTYPAQIMDATGLKSNHVSNCLKEMLQSGVVEKMDYKDGSQRIVYYRLTELGNRIITIFE